MVNAGLCHRVLVQLSYAIGVPYPLSIHVDTFGEIRTCTPSFGYCSCLLVYRMDIAEQVTGWFRVNDPNLLSMRC